MQEFYHAPSGENAGSIRVRILDRKDIDSAVEIANQ
jgi:hypothetical protein